MKFWVTCCVVGLLLSSLLNGSGNVTAQAAGSAHDVDLTSAMRVLNAALKKAQDTDTKMNIAILDAGGNLKAFVRMDDSYLGSADIAMKKAKTARMFNMPSAALGGLSQPGGPLFGIEATNGGLVTFGGGLPLANSDGKVIGAIGVSGGSVDQDLAVAQAGADAF
jgi:uncharacterized protein GlcG (DUF336 family)